MFEDGRGVANDDAEAHTPLQRWRDWAHDAHAVT
jgi:hypothetical protein